jgi:hypothetical protein
VALLLAAPLEAQDQSAELRVRLEREAGEPVAGALVALIDARDSVVAEGLSSQDGLRVLSAPRGSYRVRVRRIGFFPFVSGEVTIPRTGELRLRVASQPVSLAAVVVSARIHCRRIGEDAEALLAVWTEAMKALRASQLTLEDLAGIGRARVYMREINLRGEVVASSEFVFVVDDRRPFGAASPSVLASRGFVAGDEYKGWLYYAPDEAVLLSDAFLATHCFRVVRSDDRAGQLGVAFEPVPGRRRPDISGVLWVDEHTAELREVTFRYVNAGAATPFAPRGFTRFRRMPSGAWVVDEWQLRLPRVHRRPGAFSNTVMSGYQEHGGGIISGSADSADGSLMGATPRP